LTGQVDQVVNPDGKVSYPRRLGYNSEYGKGVDNPRFSNGLSLGMGGKTSGHGKRYRGKYPRYMISEAVVKTRAANQSLQGAWFVKWRNAAREDPNHIHGTL
jgi:hypothetical protein